MFNRKRHKKKGIHHIQTNRFIQNVNTKMHLNVFHHEQQNSRLLKRNVTFCYICLHQLLKVLYHKVLYFSNGWMHDMKWKRFRIFLFFLFFLSFFSLFTSFINLFILSYEKTPIVILFWFYNFGNNLIFIAPLWFILDIEYLFSFLSSKSSQTNAIIWQTIYSTHYENWQY